VQDYDIEELIRYLAETRGLTWQTQSSQDLEQIRAAVPGTYDPLTVGRVVAGSVISVI
jgi:hypothetical protein